MADDDAFRLVHFHDSDSDDDEEEEEEDGEVPPRATTRRRRRCALVWAADQRVLPRGCRCDDDDDETTVRCDRHARPASTTRARDAEEEEEEDDDDGVMDGGERMRLGLVWTGVRGACAAVRRAIAMTATVDDDDDGDGGGSGATGPGTRVVELGAGMGVVGIVAARALRSSSRKKKRKDAVIITDKLPRAVSLLRENVAMNLNLRAPLNPDDDDDDDDPRRGGGVKTRVARVDFRDDADIDALLRMDPWAARDGDGDGDGDGDVVDASKKSPAPAPFDVVVAADVVYDFDVVAPLLRAARKLLGGDLAQNNSNKRARDGRFIMAHTERRPPLPRPENTGETPPLSPDPHLAAFLSKAGPHGFAVRDVAFDKKDGEELVRVFELRLV